MYARTAGDGPVRALSRSGQAKWNEKQQAKHENSSATYILGIIVHQYGIR
jgi:hypothetical protein